MYFSELLTNCQIYIKGYAGVSLLLTYKCILEDNFKTCAEIYQWSSANMPLVMGISESRIF